MGTVIGDILPLAVGIAISPIPIIAAILMLFAPRAGAASAGFLLGWLAGIVFATVVFVLIAGVAGLGDSSDPSAVVSWIRLILGIGLLLLAVKQWHNRPRPGQQPSLPKWMSAIDSFTLGRALALGFALAAINPKNLAMCVGAGIAIAGGGLAGGQAAVTIVIFTVIAACTVAIPVIGHAVAADRIRGPLNRLKEWLEANSSTVMSVLLLVIGVVLIGKGIGGL